MFSTSKSSLLSSTISVPSNTSQNLPSIHFPLCFSTSSFIPKGKNGSLSLLLSEKDYYLLSSDADYSNIIQKPFPHQRVPSKQAFPPPRIYPVLIWPKRLQAFLRSIPIKNRLQFTDIRVSRVSFQRNLSGNCLSGSKMSVTKYVKNCSIKCYLWPKLL